MPAAHSVARSCARPAARSALARHGGGSTLPRLQPGEYFLVDEHGNYLTDEHGNYLIGKDNA